MMFNTDPRLVIGNIIAAEGFPAPSLEDENDEALPKVIAALKDWQRLRALEKKMNQFVEEVLNS